MISKLTRVNGVLKVDIDGSIYEPLSFKSFRPTAKNISDFSKAGVKLFSILTSGLINYLGVPYSLYGESWLGKGVYDFDVIDRQIELFRENAPGCYFALMIQLDTRDWWLKSHENYPYSFTHFSQMASDPEWREAAAEYLQQVIIHVEEKYGDIMYGYFMLCGTTTEWFSEKDYEAPHPIKEAYFKKYTNNPNAVIPTGDRLVLDEDISFIDDAELKIYRKAHGEQTADTILYFADKAQEVLKHKKLLGIYYGYLFELGYSRIWNTGHLGYEKVFMSKDIDIISSPSSYAYRGLDSTSAFMVTFKTLDMHDKLYYLEFDHITHLAPTHVGGTNVPIPGWKNKCKDQTETLNLMQRDFMLCAANGAALWWFDMFEGWFYSDEMMECIQNMILLAHKLSAYKQESIAEIAVIASGETLYGVNKTARINDKLLGMQRNGLARMGAPYDVYSAGDLTNFEWEQYKFIIFLDAFEITKGQKQVIEKMKKAGKTLLWMYAPDYLTGGLDAMKSVMDMEVMVLDEPVQTVEQGGVVMSKPQFTVTDPEGVTLVRYENGMPAIAYKKKDGYISVYSGIGNLDGNILRRIAKLAGVHIYSENAPVYVNSKVIGVYAVEDTEITVKQSGVYEDVFTGKRYETKDNKISVKAEALHSKLFIKI